MPSDPIAIQLKRIRGQLVGVLEMYESERTCTDVVRQIIAARNSLTSVARTLLTEEAMKCSKERRIGDLDIILQEVFKY